jgi:glycine/D-amino acid oxidase-like deaminating enzyme
MTIKVIGGGIIGLSVAYHLSRNASGITVYETDKSYATASFARSCGGLRSQFSQPANILMSQYSIDFIKNQVQVAFTGNGYLMLFDRDKAADHDQSLVLQQKLGASTESLSPQELSQLFPDLFRSDLYRGCITRNQSEGWIDTNELHG